jgi:hypothetical protein
MPYDFDNSEKQNEIDNLIRQHVNNNIDYKNAKYLHKIKELLKQVIQNGGTIYPEDMHFLNDDKQMGGNNIDEYKNSKYLHKIKHHLKQVVKNGGTVHPQDKHYLNDDKQMGGEIIKKIINNERYEKKYHNKLYLEVSNNYLRKHLPVPEELVQFIEPYKN